MFLAVDGVPLLNPPVSIDILPPELTEHNLADGGFVAVESHGGASIVVRFGQAGVTQAAMLELLRRRANIGIHTLTFEDAHCNEIITVNVYMPPVERVGLPYGESGELLYAETSITFRQVQPTMDIGHFRLRARGVITVGDSKDECRAMAAGRLFAVSGWIRTLGTGAGQTRIQLRNGLMDYLTVPGDFVVASGTNILESQALRTDTTAFIKGEYISLDVDAIPGGADAADAFIYVWYYHFRP